MKKIASILIVSIAGLLIPCQADAQQEAEKIRSNIINSVFPVLYSPEMKMKTNSAFQLTSRSDFQWNVVIEDWVEAERSEFDYDESGRIEELYLVIQDSQERPEERRLIERFENSEIWTDEVYSEMTQDFEPDLLTTIEYSDELSGYPDEIVIQEWVNDAWQNIARQTFHYSNGNFDHIHIDVWRDSEWINDTRSTLSEDNGDVMILEEQWDVNSEEWQNVFREKFFNITSSEIFEFFLNVEIFGDDYPELYAVEPIPGGVIEVWEDGAWEFVLRRVVDVEFQNGSVPSSKELRLEEWDGDSWQLDVQFTYQYNSEGDPIELSGKVPTDGEELLEVLSEEYIYDNEGLLTSITTRTFDGETLALAERYEFSWASQPVSIAGTGEDPAGYSLGNAYPNPFNPETVVPYTLNETSHVEITLHDILGRKVDLLYSGTQTSGTHQIRVDGARLSSGQYIVRMTADDFITTRSVTLIK